MERKYKVPDQYSLKDYWRRTRLVLTGSPVRVSTEEKTMSGVQIKDGSVLYVDKYHKEAQHILQEGDKIVRTREPGLERAIGKIFSLFS